MIHQKAISVKIAMSPTIKLLLLEEMHKCVRFPRIQDSRKEGAASERKGDPFSGEGLDDTRRVPAQKNTVTGNAPCRCP